MMAQIIINLDKVTVSLAGRPIFQELGWEIQAGQRIGLVGPNGAGKSTLMKLLVGDLVADEGNIYRQSGVTWGYLEQEPVMAPGRSIWQEAMTANPELTALEARIEALETKLSDPVIYEDMDKLEKVMARHARLLGDYERLDGTRYTSQVKDALSRVGFPPERWVEPVDRLSGGEKKLVLLAKLLIQRPGLLLLDEPDNHLDVPGKRQLEQIIRSYDGCVVIISHDRYLLDEVTTAIAELENGRLTVYAGNYTAYTAERELRRLRQQQLYAAQQKEIAAIEAAIARFEHWAAITVDERHIRQARHRRKMLDRMDKVEKVTVARRISLELDGWRGSNKAIELTNVTKQLPNGRILWQDINLTLWHGERVGLVGPNGAGKSMLLKQLLAPELVSGGTITIGPSCRIGYYAQEQETLDPARTLLEEIRQTASLSENGAVAFLTRFLFTYDQVRGRIGDLSGGERSRLQLARLVLTGPNLLLLDEPTNNLDIASIEVLEQTLEEFEGTVLVISHDRYFLDQVVDRIIALEDGGLKEFLGGYTDYLDAAGVDYI